jgi:hypothetical protein
MGGGQPLLQQTVGARDVRKLDQVIPEGKMAPNVRAAFFERVNLVRSCSLDRIFPEVASIWDSKFPFRFISQVNQVIRPEVECLNIIYLQQDVDDRLGEYSGNGRASNMVHIRYHLAKTTPNSITLSLESSRPAQIVWNHADLHDPSQQSAAISQMTAHGR